MAPSRPIHRRTKIHRTKNGSRQQSKPPELTLTQLIDEATRFLHTGNPSAALPLALRVLNSSKSISASLSVSLSALNLLAEIHLELGDADTARSYFLQAVNLDPEGEVPEDEGGGAEKFLWLAQLCEEGGEESVRWFERGAAVLRRDIATEENKDKGTEKVEEKKKKLAGVLCGIIEVYMTDLSYVGSPAFPLNFLCLFPTNSFQLRTFCRNPMYNSYCLCSCSCTLIPYPASNARLYTDLPIQLSGCVHRTPDFSFPLATPSRFASGRAGLPV